MNKKAGQIFSRTLTRLILTIAIVSTVACSDSEPAAQSSAATTNYNAALSIRDFMTLVLDPAADALWASAGWVNSIEAGYQELYPTTDEQWAYVRQQSATIIELGNALAVPGRAVDNDAWTTYANGLSNAAILAMNAASEQNKEDFFQAGAQLYSVCTACHQAYNSEISGASGN